MNHIQILEGNEAEAALDRLKTIVALSPQEEGSPKVDLRKQSECLVAPVAHSGTLTPDILKKFFDAAKTTGHDTMTAVGLYSAEEQHCYSVPMTAEGVDELRGTTCGVVNFVLFAGAPDWLVIFDDQLYIAYGPASFVSALVGDVSSAYKTFESTIDRLKAESKGEVPAYVAQEIARLSRYLGSALTKLSDGYAKAEAGEMVNVV